MHSDLINYIFTFFHTYDVYLMFALTSRAHYNKCREILDNYQKINYDLGHIVKLSTNKTNILTILQMDIFKLYRYVKTNNLPMLCLKICIGNGNYQTICIYKHLHDVTVRQFDLHNNLLSTIKLSKLLFVKYITDTKKMISNKLGITENAVIHYDCNNLFSNSHI